MAEIHDLQDEYEFEKIAVIGTRLEEVQWPVSDSDTGEVAPAGKIHMLSGLVETSLLIDNEHTIPFLKATFGLGLEPVSGTELSEFHTSSAVKTMGCWPEGDSLAVIDDVLVLKLSDRAERPYTGQGTEFRKQGRYRPPLAIRLGTIIQMESFPILRCADF